MSNFGFTQGAADDAKQYEIVKDKVTSSLKDYFRPEFLNRLDEIILFNILSPDAIKTIVDMQVKIIQDRLTAKEIKLDIKPEVYDYLAKEGYNPQYGARPLKRLIQTKILTPVASFMVSQGVMDGGSIIVGLKDAEKGEFGFEVKKAPRKSHVKPKTAQTA